MKKIPAPSSAAELRSLIAPRSAAIRNRLMDFSQIPPSEYFYELVYCVLTPQSSAVNAEKVVRLLREQNFWHRDIDPEPILNRKDCYIRFHKTKARSLVIIKTQFSEVAGKLENGTSSEITPAKHNNSRSKARRNKLAVPFISVLRLSQAAHISSKQQPVVVQLSPEESTPTAIVRRASMEDADSLIVDQLSFVRPDANSRSVKRNEQLADIMRSFATLIKHEYSLPLILLSQINREGVTAARKTGRYFKEHLAEGSWIEQSSDVVLALFQSDVMAEMEHAQIQQLKGRRTGIRHFDTIWRPYVGDVRLLREVTLSETPAPEGKAA